MKKLSLNASGFQKGEVLTRKQLKKVLGGNGSGIGGSGSGADCNDECSSVGSACDRGESKGICTVFNEYETCGKYVNRCIV